MDGSSTEFFLNLSDQLKDFGPCLSVFIIQMMLTLRDYDILDEARLRPVVRVVSQEFLIGKKFVLKTTDWMESVNRGDDLASFYTACL